MSKTAQNLDNLRDQTDDELREALAATRDELFRLKLGQYTNQVTSTAQLTTKRRDIARIMTLLRARNLGLEAQAQKTADAPAGDASEAAPKKKSRKAKAE
jgi:large subunit ribosomal protein L29